MLKAILSSVVAIVSIPALYWLGIATGVWYDHRPAHSPVVHVGFLHWTPPDSLDAKLQAAQARQADLAAANAILTRALQDQTGRVVALGRQGAQLKADSGAQVAKRLHELAALQGRLAKLQAKPVGADRCARADDALATLKETLR